ncbi:cupin domain-containing protein [Poseidonibacter lekithochrous]|uniref:cupin domain-containing protein n=1 Tax=Poseidonibacter lekithochrous TaxID=1904463 RepID=UPI000AD4D060|nr:cupin domain-containing protein [Poseidonibacter lekithochrous]QKJ23574.1 Cupin domain-containing protein [Poseidonibacter lekithochrous]
MKINIKEKFSLFSEEWTPKIITQSNGQLVKIAKGSGELVWHKHVNEDELFIVFKGELTLQLKTENIVLSEGEMYVVPKGVEHCPIAKDDTHFMMIEPASTAHTGDLESDVTVSSNNQEWI